ncbi:MAG TPA: hypothetical protein VK449_02375, partial [Anaerolineales bacterium]|nr:hypothetical protein [Anaerolineales bacterium]
MIHRSIRLASLAALLCLSAACSASSATPAGGKMVLRVGFFPNVTHSQALIGLARGDFAKA